MKEYTIQSASITDFLNGRVFGFDLGTVGTAHAVRDKQVISETGVLECPNETAALAGRRKLRNGRRVMDHRQDRRDWFAQSLAAVLNLELHADSRLPKTSWQSVGDGLWKPTQPQVSDPLPLRVAALAGEPLSPEKLFAALTHLVKRRGPARPPWADSLTDEKDEEDEEAPDPSRISPDETKSRYEKARVESQQPAGFHPCHYLRMLRETKQRQRNHAWPRELMRGEAAAIMAAQSSHYAVFKQEREVIDVTGETIRMTTAEWLLRGNAALLTRPEGESGGSFDVFYRNHRNRERAPFTFQAARIHNRGPGLDLIHPRSEDGRKYYVMSRSHPAYRAWQVEVALLNFRVANLEKRPNKKGKFPNMVVPPDAMEELKKQIAVKLQRLSREEHENTEVEEDEEDIADVEHDAKDTKKKRKDEATIFSLDNLKKWEEPYRKAGKFQLQDGQRDLVGKAKGRGKFGRHGLEDAWRILRQLQEMEKPLAAIRPTSKRQQKKLKSRESQVTAFVQKQQPEYLNMTPKLRLSQMKDGKPACGLEPLPRALKRFIDEIRDPVVQHRVRLFDQLLGDLVKRHGIPTHIVVECVRELNVAVDDAKRAKDKRDAGYKENKLARDTLKDMGLEANDKNIRKFRLLQECKWRCPYNPEERFMQSDFDDLVLQRLIPPADDGRRAAYLTAARRALNETEIEHMVPQSNLVCDEWFNVTVTRRATNEAKGPRTPYEFVLRDADEATREIIIKNARDIFGEDSLKFKIFTSPDARSLIDSSANLTRTAYIARCVRYVCLLKFGWLTDDGRDPLQEPGHEVNQRYLVSNGGITHRLRKAWQLDELLHDDKMSDEAWKALTDEEKDELIAQRRQKNRQDLRHHALDAMVLSCTLPWAASSPDYAGGWCHLDPQDGSVSSVACPIFGDKDHGQKIKELAAEKLLALKQSDPQDKDNHDRIQHYRSNGKHAGVFDTQFYGRRERFGGKELKEPVFVIRKPLAELTPDCLQAPRPDPILDQIKDDVRLANDASLWGRRLAQTQEELRNEIAQFDSESKEAALLTKRLSKTEGWQKKKPTAKRWEELERFLYPSASGNVVFSPKLREHIRKAWTAYTAEAENWQRVLKIALDVQQQNLQEAKANPKTKPPTLRAIEKRIWRLQQWQQNEAPDLEDWDELQTFLHRESGAQQAKPVFPADFIQGLWHPDFTHAPLRRVKVTQQTKDEGNYVPMRAGTYLKYKGGFKSMKVYDAPPGSSRGTDFICWLVRPFYPNPDKLRNQDLLEKNKPKDCKGRKLRATFKIGDVVRFEHAIPSKGVEAGTNWMLCESMSAGENNARLTLVPAHKALKVRDPLDPKKTLDLKKTDKLDIRLNDFMRALDYEPAHHPSAKS